MRDLLVAAVCRHSEPGEVEKNLERMESFVGEESDKKAHAVLFPELSISGYVLKNPEKGKYREGDGLDVFHDDGLSFGVELCYESHFPEISTVLCLKGAEILFMP